MWQYWLFFIIGLAVGVLIVSSLYKFKYGEELIRIDNYEKLPQKARKGKEALDRTMEK